MTATALTRRFLLAFTAVAVAGGIFAAAASAHVGKVTISCTGVTFSYHSFPKTGTNSVNETVTINGKVVAKKTFTFTGPTATNTIPIHGMTGETVTGTATWTVDGGGHASATEKLSGCKPPPPCKGAPTGFPDLGGAYKFTVFALNGTGGTQSANFSLDTVDGNVGVADGATVTNQAPSKIDGNVYVDSTGSFSGPGTVSGTVYTGQNVSGDRTDAINASADAAGLSPTVTYSSITSTTTVTGNPGLNVVDITGSVNLNNGSLILSGPSNAYFVVNIGGSITLVGNGGIEVGGSVSATHLVINMTGNGSGLIQTHVGNTVEGTLLAPYAGGSLDGAFGSLLLGEDFTLMSGVQVSYQGCAA